MKEKPKWLTRIQENSWEPELFISGGAIFTLLQANETLQTRSFILFQQSGYFESILIAQLMISAINALIFGFALHLIARGFWIGSVCLSYAFPNNINLDNSGYADIFKKKLEDLPDTDIMVVKLERFSSIIFFLSFFFFLIILGVFITLLLLIPHSSLIESIGEQGFYTLQIGSYIILALGSLYLIDFITLGYIKKQKWMAKFYYPIYLFYSVLTLSFLYRGAYYALMCSIRPWMLGLAVASYIGVAAGLTAIRYGGLPTFIDPHEFLNVKSEGYKHDTRYYDDERPEDQLIQHVSIQSSIIQDSYIKLFLVHQKLIEKTMSLNLKGNTKTEMSRYLCNPENLKYFASFYQVYIDNKLIENITWRQYQHPQTKELGIIAYIPVKDIELSEHILSIKLDLVGKDKMKSLKKFGMTDNTYAFVPFWKD